MIDAGDWHFSDSEALFSGLDEDLNAEAKAFLGDIDSFQQPSAMSSEAALGIRHLHL